MSEPQQTFKRISEVKDFLIRRGYRFGKTKLYEDRKRGLLTQTDGVFTADTVLAYAKANLKMDDRLDTRKHQVTRIQSQARKEAAQAELAEMKARQMRGDLIPVEEFEQELVKRAVALKTGFLNFAKSNAAQIIQISGGDRGRAPELKVFLLTAFENIFDDYAKNPVLEVPVAGSD